VSSQVYAVAAVEWPLPSKKLVHLTSNRRRFFRRGTVAATREARRPRKVTTEMREGTRWPKPNTGHRTGDENGRRWRRNRNEEGGEARTGVDDASGGSGPFSIHGRRA
jgi:hypothetical protein